MGIPVARIELLDEVQVKACNAYSKLGLPELPLLMFEFHGTAASTREQAETVGELAAGNGGSGFKWATQEEERRALWQARHDAYYACLALKPGAHAFATDVCVPISRLAECLLETKADIEATGAIAPIVGHVGDGNFHLVYLLDPNDPEERRKADGLNDRMVSRALALGGTCTGEHGIGIGKREFLIAEHGEAVALMRHIKRALDPKNLLNPGKILRV
jgi:D-lactate dehydrogenase (cytochrome)